MSKVFERLLQTRIVNHINDKNILQPEQFGFRNKHSTTQQLMRIIERTHSGFSVGGKTIIAFLDVEKAFDKIWTEGLLLKCLVADFPDWMILIINSFLRKRTFKVRINRSISPSYEINAGVPQGSVLGPILFNIYVSDLRLAPPAEIALFADDTAIYVRSINPARGISQLQTALDFVGRWFRQWKLHINENKTKAMILSRDSRIKTNRQLTLYNKAVEWVGNYCYLGVTLDSTLTFTQHIKNKVHSARIARMQLRPLLNKNSKLSTKNKILILNQIFMPALLYASVVWANAPKSAIELLVAFQRMFIKTALGIPRHVNGDLIRQQLGIPSIEERIYDLHLNYYERLSDHPNSLMHDTVKYDLRQWRKRPRPRDYLLKKPP